VSADVVEERHVLPWWQVHVVCESAQPAKVKMAKCWTYYESMKSVSPQR
jgi:hypothetical protein